MIWHIKLICVQLKVCLSPLISIKGKLNCHWPTYFSLAFLVTQRNSQITRYYNRLKNIFITNIAMISLFYFVLIIHLHFCFLLLFNLHSHYCYITCSHLFLNYTCHCFVWFYSSIFKYPLFILFPGWSFLKSNSDHSLNFEWPLFQDKDPWYDFICFSGFNFSCLPYSPTFLLVSWKQPHFGPTAVSVCMLYLLHILCPFCGV